MKTKPTWKPVGHSAKKWREMARRRGSLAVLPEPRPPKKGTPRQKPRNK